VLTLDPTEIVGQFSVPIPYNDASCRHNLMILLPLPTGFEPVLQARYRSRLRLV
jgi:hypothetical protein